MKFKEGDLVKIKRTGKIGTIRSCFWNDDAEGWYGPFYDVVFDGDMIMFYAEYELEKE